jgi:hypothetical protein
VGFGYVVVGAAWMRDLGVRFNSKAEKKKAARRQPLRKHTEFKHKPLKYFGFLPMV